jgi:hypothetical protein
MEAKGLRSGFGSNEELDASYRAGEGMAMAWTRRLSPEAIWSCGGWPERGRRRGCMRVARKAYLRALLL